MRITVMTQDRSLYGLRLLNLLRRNGTDVEQVIVLTSALQRNWRLLRSMGRRMGWLQALEYAARHSLRPRGSETDWRGAVLERAYPRLARRVDYAPSAKSPEVLNALSDGGPDLCLLGQSGIVSEAALAIPKLATFNAHPGILPDYRGVDVYFWAIYEKRFDHVGSTLHLVNADVDTGRIVETRPWKWRGDETSKNLGARLYEDCLDMLAAACREGSPERILAALPQSGGNYYYAMPPRLLGAVDRNLKEYLAALPNSAEPSAFNGED